MPQMGTVCASVDRLDWRDIKDRINLEVVAVALLGPPAKRQGRRMLWRCPWHDDHDPSLMVDPDRGTWRCWPCNLGGDAVALAKQAHGLAFPEAVRLVAELSGLVPSTGVIRPTPSLLGPLLAGNATRPAKAPTRPPERPSGLPLADAVALVEEAAKRLWTPEGADALAYLQSRGLTDETAFAARLGFVPNVAIPKANGSGTYRASGIVIPWFDGDRLALVKIRQRDGIKPKYAEAFRDRPRAFPTFDFVRLDHPLVVAEGEFDALLLGQEIGGFTSVVTLGSASTPLDPDIRRLARGCSALFTAHHADEAGDRAAETWPKRSIRVRPPEGFNDWTDLHKAGFNRIRYAWGRYLPMAATWEQLADQRWRPSSDETVADDRYALEEREAIQIESPLEMTTKLAIMVRVGERDRANDPAPLDSTPA